MIRRFNARLLFTDTDNLRYELYEKNLHKKMYKYKGIFDLSKQPKDGKYFWNDDKKVPGKIKGEYGRKSVLKFLGLKSKMYSILDESNNEKSTSKDHNAFVEFQEFDDTLFKKTILRHTVRGIKPKNNNLGTYKTNKISLSCFDDKRYILKIGFNTLAYGHKDI